MRKIILGMAILCASMSSFANQSTACINGASLRKQVVFKKYLSFPLERVKV